MTGLEKAILDAQNAYYNLGASLMSDADYDELWDKLKREQPDSELLKKVGEDHADGFKKVKHIIVMGSQEKANTEEDMEKWISSLPDRSVIGSHKMDGISLELVYNKGTLERCVTRGDGKVGDDITQNAIKMHYVPLELKDHNFTGAVRGEVLLSRKNKDEFFPDKANCRNAASGVIKRLDGTDSDKLALVCYDAQSSEITNYFGTQIQLQSWLADNGFKVAEYKIFDNVSSKETIEYLNETFDRFDSLEYDIDGIVWKRNVIDPEDLKEYRPSQQRALKPARTYAESVISGIEWNCKNGTYTPVAIYNPVQLNGATVERASLSNVAQLEQLQLEIGDTVKICRAGMIIPKVVANMSKGTFIEGYYS